MLQPPFQSNKVPLPAEPPKTIAKCVYFAKKRLEVHVVHHFGPVRSDWAPFSCACPVWRQTGEAQRKVTTLRSIYIYVSGHSRKEALAPKHCFEIRAFKGLTYLKTIPAYHRNKKNGSDHASTCQPKSQEVWLLLALSLWSYGWVCGRSWPRRGRRRRTLRRGRCFLTSQSVWGVIFSGVFSCAVEASVGLDVVDKRRRGWLRRRRCDKQSRVDSDKDIDENCGGGVGVDWGQQGGNWRTLAKAAIKLFSLCTRNISRTWSDKGGAEEVFLVWAKERKGGLFAGSYVTERMASLQLFDANGNFLYCQNCIVSVLGIPQ